MFYMFHFSSKLRANRREQNNQCVETEQRQIWALDNTYVYKARPLSLKISSEATMSVKSTERQRHNEFFFQNICASRSKRFLSEYTISYGGCHFEDKI